MSKPYDASSKWLLDLNPDAWTKFCGYDAKSVRVIDANISSVTADCDKVILVDDPSPWLLNVEFFSWADLEADFTMLFQNVVLKRKHKLPVRSVMVLLGTRARSPHYTGIYGLTHNGVPILEGFHYSVIDTSRIPATELIKQDVAIVPIAMAANYPKTQYREIFHQVQEVIWSNVPQQQAKELVQAALILGGLNLPRKMVERLMQDVTKFKESTAYQIIHEQGEILGRAQGELEGARKLLVRICLKRLGEPSRAVLNRLGAITDIEVIHKMSDRLQEVESWDELIPVSSTPNKNLG